MYNAKHLKAYVGAVGATKLTAIFVMVCILGVFAVTFVGPALAAANIRTTNAEGIDQTDFATGDTVYIHGSGFVPQTPLTVSVTRPDLTIESCINDYNCHYRFLSGPLTSDENGAFSFYPYLLNGIEGTYTIDVSDGMNSAQTTFTDTSPVFKIRIVQPANNSSPASPVRVYGTWNVTNPPGKLSQYNVQIQWGDGSINSSININRTKHNNHFFSGTFDTEPIVGCTGGDDNCTTGNFDHTYTSCGPFTITVKLYHTQPPGNEAGDASASVTVNPAENCTDGIDNDCDGATDCLDSDCAQAPNCMLTCDSYNNENDCTNESTDTCAWCPLCKGPKINNYGADTCYDEASCNCQYSQCSKLCGAECTTNSDCKAHAGGVCNLETCTCQYEYHTICSNGYCTEVQGAGTNECTFDNECRHTECAYENTIACIQVMTPGTNQCSVADDCGKCIYDTDCPADYYDCNGNTIILHDNYCGQDHYCHETQSEGQNCDLSDYTACDGTAIKNYDYYCQNPTSSGDCKGPIVTLVQECNDGVWCNGQETCSETPNVHCVQGTPVDCSQYNILGIATCDNIPDNYHPTWDFRNAFTSQCVEDGGNQGHCTRGDETITHTCSVEECGAECDAINMCANRCSAGDVYEYDGICQENCTCLYRGQKDCDWYDGWYCNGNNREYRDYYCDVNGVEGCSYTVTDTDYCDDEDPCTIDTCIYNPETGAKCINTFSDTEGPITSNVVVTPAFNNGIFNLTAHVEDTCSNIKIAKYYIGAGGSGRCDDYDPFIVVGNMLPTDGNYDELIEDVYINNANFFRDGVNFACVKSWDVLNNVGNCACAYFETDILPPDCPYDIYLDDVLYPNEYLICGNNAWLNATVCDQQSKIQGGEYFIDVQIPPIPAPWSGIWMDTLYNFTRNDGWKCAVIGALVNTSNFSDGTHYIRLRGKDTAENWGKISECLGVSFIRDTLAPVTTKTLAPAGGASHTCEQSEITEAKLPQGVSLTDGCQFVKTGTTITLHAEDPDPQGTGEHADKTRIYWKVYYKVNPNDEWTLDQQGVGDENADVVITLNKDSYHLIEYWSVDACGWEETHHFELDIVDNQPPVTVKTISNPKVQGNNDPINWYITKDTTIELSCTDPQPHPVDHVTLYWALYYTQGECLPAGADWGTPIASGQEEGGYKLITGLEDSCHKLVYYCVDALGNEEDTKVEIDAVDNQAPPIVKSIIGPSYGNCLPEAKQVSFLKDDNFAGVDDTTGFSTGDNTVDLKKTAFSILSGQGSVTGFKNGGQGNLTHRGTRGLGVYPGELDEVDEPERIEITFTKPYLVDYVELRSLFADECNDGGSDEKAHIRYYLAGNLVGSEDPVGVETGGNGTWSKSYASPIAADKVVFYAEDDGCSEFAVAKLGLVDACFIDGVTLIHVESTDPQPHPVDQVTCDWDYEVLDGQKQGQGQVNIIPPFNISFPEESTHVLTITCRDALGNEATDVEIFIVDKTPPTTTKTYGEPKFVEEGGYPTWITSQTPITLTVEDTGVHKSGIKETKYRVTQVNDNYCLSQTACEEAGGSGEWSTYEEPFTINEDSCHLIEYYSVDNVEKTETTKRQCVYVDNKPPISSKSFDGFNMPCDQLPCRTEGECDYYINQDTKIVLTCEDQLPHPVDQVKIYYRYNVDDGEWTDWTLYEGPFSYDEDSKHTLEWYCVDALGNKEETHTQVERVDTTPPVTTKTIGDPKWENGYWVTSETPITLTAVDGGAICAAGPWKLYYKLSWDKNCDGDFDDFGEQGPWNYVEVDTGTCKLEKTLYLEGECLHQIEWYAVDALGNTEQVHVQQHKVDNTPPHILILKPVDGWYSKGEDIPIIAEVKDLNNAFGPCEKGENNCHGLGDNCAVGITDGAQCYAFLVNLEFLNMNPMEIFNLSDVVKYDLDTEGTLLYNADAKECQGYATIPEDSDVQSGIHILVVGAKDNLGNEANSIDEIILAIRERCDGCWGDPYDLCKPECVRDVLQDIITNWNLPKIGIDTEAPKVTITSPEAGDHVDKGQLFVSADVTESGITCAIMSGTPCYVKLGSTTLGTFYYDNTNRKCEGTLVVPEDVPQGTEVPLTVEVSDNCGNIGKGVIYVLSDTMYPTPLTIEAQHVENPPYDTDGFYYISWDGGFDANLYRYELYEDSLLIYSGVAKGYSREHMSEGNHRYQVKAYDKAGHVTVSSFLDVFVDTKAPNVDITGTIPYGLGFIFTYEINDPSPSSGIVLPLVVEDIEGPYGFAICSNTLPTGFCTVFLGTSAKLIACDNAGHCNFDTTETAPQDTTPPILVMTAPSGVIEYNNVVLYAKTNEPAVCFYDTFDNVDTMKTMNSNEDKTEHQVILGMLEDGLYVYHIRCQDLAGNMMEQSKTIVFGINTESQFSLVIPSKGPNNPGGYWNIGWNTFWLPQIILDDICGIEEGQYKVEDVLSSLYNDEGANFDIIWYFDGEEWLYFIPEYPEFSTLKYFNDQSSLPYYIHITSEDRLEITQDICPPIISPPGPEIPK